MSKQKKAIPVFSSEQEEREFWTSHDSSEYIDWNKAVPAIFPELKQKMKKRLKEYIDREYDPKQKAL
jgi:hypothetical protein